MTVQTETSRVSYTGSGTTGPFTIPFYFLANADIRVVKQTISTGAETELALTTDFTLTGAGEAAGGELTLVSSISSSYKLVIFRDPEILQETAYPRNDPFPAESHEEAIDRLTMIAQRQSDLLGRAVRLSEGDVSGASMVLPAKVDRESKVLGFDADGAVEVYDSSSAVTSSENINHLEDGTGATSRTVAAILRERIHVKNYANASGACAGDFDQATGVGTDDRVAIQRALTYAMTKARGAVIVFDPGDFYLGTGYSDSTSGVAAQLILGSRSTANSAAKIDIEGYGASVYAGAAGRSLVIANGANVSIRGLRMIGYAGGSLGASREYDNAIYIGWSSRHINILDCYLSNYLGWIIGGGGDTTVAGGDTGKTVRAIRIEGNTIKGRYGNGTVASSGGSLTQQCIQFIDVDGIKVVDNTIYGRTKLEPNLSGQYMANIDVHDNAYRSGFVTAITPSGATNYWADEELGAYDGGGSELVQALSLDGIPGSPKVHNNNFHGNTFENGQIVGCTGPYIVNISHNKFQKGKILIAADAVAADRYFECSYNTAYQTTDASTGFIVLQSAISQASFAGNVLINEDLPCIGKSATGSDGGDNTYLFNASLASTGFAVDVGTLGTGTIEFASSQPNSGATVGSRAYINNSLYTTGTLTERSRTTPAGEWVSVAHNAANFTCSGTGTWTVAAGDQSYFKYSLIGKTMTVNFKIDTSSRSNNDGRYLYIAIPGSAVSAEVVYGLLKYYDGTAWSTGFLSTDGGTTLRLEHDDNGNWANTTDGTYVYGSITFEID